MRTLRDALYTDADNSREVWYNFIDPKPLVTMGKLMPILKPAGYRANDPLFFREPLFESSDAPVVAFGIDDDDTIMYQGASDDADYAQKLPAVREEALKNLADVKTSIDLQDTGNTRVAFVMSSEYASEKILDKAFMQDLGSRIGSTSLMVGIPFKGLLIATDANGDIRLKFPVIIKRYYDDPQDDALSDKVFLVQDGEVMAMAGENIKEDFADTFVIAEQGQTNNYRVELKSLSLEGMTRDIESSLRQIVAMLVTRKVFGGQVRYDLSPRMTFTEELSEKCKSYVRQIETNEGAQSRVLTATGSRLNVVFYYNDKQIAPLA